MSVVNAQQAADLLGVKAGTVRRWEYRYSECPKRKNGLWEWEDLSAWAASTDRFDDVVGVLTPLGPFGRRA